MKVWYAYGSEHSANLVMIGTFKSVAASVKANEMIKEIKRQVEIEIEAGSIKTGGETERFSDEMMSLLRRFNVLTLGPAELEQFAYDVKVQVKEQQVIVTTDELEVSAFMKILLDHEARLEIYSAHDYPGTGYGRGG